MVIRQLSLRAYLEQALHLAEYAQDENGVWIAKVPGVEGYFAQGHTVEDAREALADIVEGNVLLALQLGFPIPPLPGVEISEQDVA
jgi:predicted RNase H-like HicB family nuclease